MKPWVGEKKAKKKKKGAWFASFFYVSHDNDVWLCPTVIKTYHCIRQIHQGESWADQSAFNQYESETDEPPMQMYPYVFAV